MIKYAKSMPYNMIHLCIDAYNEYEIIGRCYTPTINEPLLFSDIHDAILKIDTAFDDNGNPLSSQTKRSFNLNKKISKYQFKPEIIHDYSNLEKEKGCILTCDIVVKSRRSSCWQGIIFINDKEYKFSSYLNMLKILENTIKKL